MSSATQQDVNPYASPAVPVAHLVPEIGPGTPYRASSGALKYISRHASVANVVYPMNAVCWFLAMIPLASHEFSQIMMIAWAVFSFVLWYSSIAMTFGSRNYIVGALVALLLPIPCFGSVVFWCALDSTKDFMIGNGYRPGLLGFKPDDEDRRLMEADLQYVPAKSFHNDGSKRPNVFMLGECAFLLGILLFGVSIFATM